MLCYDTMAASLMEGPDLPLYYPDFSLFFFSETVHLNTEKLIKSGQCVSAWAELAPRLVRLSSPSNQSEALGN